MYLSPVSGAFFLMNEILGAQIPFRNASVYDISPELFDGQQFDLVFMGALLVHVRDPIGALMAARSVCRGKIIASTLVDLWDESPKPSAQLAWTTAGAIGWWLPNVACFREWFLAAGFCNPDVSGHVKLSPDCPDPEWEGGVQIHGVGHACGLSSSDDARIHDPGAWGPAPTGPPRTSAVRSAPHERSVSCRSAGPRALDAVRERRHLPVSTAWGLPASADATR